VNPEVPREIMLSDIHPMIAGLDVLTVLEEVGERDLGR
jgi:hypothetical protein